MRVPANVPGQLWLRRMDTRVEVLVAMPEQRARMLRATRSPSRILRIGPVTVAQWVIGLIGVVSVMCHVTLL